MISLLIPTHNRPSYLKRILAYYSDDAVDYNIIVADSSSDEVKKANRETVASFPVLKIQHLDAYSSEIHPHDKIVDALRSVDTEYCAVCADDDFITPNGINQSVDFLEHNPGFGIAHGRYISFHAKDEGGKLQFCWIPLYSPQSIVFPDPEMRLTHHLSNYLTATFYAVHRTDLMRMIWTERMKCAGGELFSELLLSALTLIYGKMKCLDVLYAARDESSGSRVWRTPADAVKEGTYEEEYGRFKDCLAIQLSQQSQLAIPDSRGVVDKATASYMNKYYGPPKTATGHFTTTLGHSLERLHLPDWADRGLRRWYARLTGQRYYSAGMPRTSKYYSDFDRIRHHVLLSVGTSAGKTY